MFGQHGKQLGRPRSCPHVDSYHRRRIISNNIPWSSRVKTNGDIIERRFSRILVLNRARKSAAVRSRTFAPACSIGGKTCGQLSALWRQNLVPHSAQFSDFIFLRLGPEASITALWIRSRVYPPKIQIESLSRNTVGSEAANRVSPSSTCIVSLSPVQAYEPQGATRQLQAAR